MFFSLNQKVEKKNIKLLPEQSLYRNGKFIEVI